MEVQIHSGLFNLGSFSGHVNVVVGGLQKLRLGTIM